MLVAVASSLLLNIKSFYSGVADSLQTLNLHITIPKMPTEVRDQDGKLFCPIVTIVAKSMPFSVPYTNRKSQIIHVAAICIRTFMSEICSLFCQSTEDFTKTGQAG